MANGDGCARSWTVSSTGAFAFETTQGTQNGTLSAEERSKLGALVSDLEFTRTLGAPEPVCPVKRSFQVVITLERADRVLRDPYAQGCVGDGYEEHPYYALRKLMKELSASHFDAGAI